MEWTRLSDDERAVIMDIFDRGPDCAKFLARRLTMDLSYAMQILKGLENSGWLERVEGTFLFKKGMRRPKHMNHTYFQLARRARRRIRKHRRLNNAF